MKKGIIIGIIALLLVLATLLGGCGGAPQHHAYGYDSFHVNVLVCCKINKKGRENLHVLSVGLAQITALKLQR